MKPVQVLAWLCLASLSVSAQTVTLRTVDTGSGAVTGKNVSHAVAGGRPVMTYLETRVPPFFAGNTLRRILFARNSAADGSGAWSTSPVGFATDDSSAVAEVAGNPALVYQKNNTLWFARNSAADGSGAWIETQVSWLSGTGPVCLAVIGGKPVAVFHDGQNLYFALSYSADGSSGWLTTVIDQEDGGIGSSISLMEVAGTPAVSYRVETDPVNISEGTTYDKAVLRYARCATADGSGTWTRTTVFETTNNVSVSYFQNSLAVIDGKPAIAYYFATDLYFARCATTDGSGAWTSAAIETSGSSGQYPTLTTIAGNPAVSHYKSTGGDDLCFTRCATTDGSGAWTTANVDTAGLVGSFASMAVVDGNPAIGYFNLTNNSLKWTRNAQPDASGAWTAVTVDDGTDAGITGIESQIGIVAGNPAATFYDRLHDTYNFARATTATGTTGAWTKRSLTGAINPKPCELGGLPAFAFVSNAGKLSVLTNSAADGSGTDTTTIVDPVSAFYHGSSAIATVAGFPAIAYNGSEAFNPYALKLAINSAADGSGTWNVVAALGWLSPFYQPVAAEIAGTPAVLFVDDNYNFRFIRNSAADGSGAWTSTIISDASLPSVVSNNAKLFTLGGFPAVVFPRYSTVDFTIHTWLAVNSSADGSGTWTVTDVLPASGSFSFIGGHPCVACTRIGENRLRLYRSATTSFTGPWESYLLDGRTVITGDVSLAAVGTDGAGITYQDSENAALKYAHVDFSSAAISSLRLELPNGTILPGAGSTANFGGSKITVPDGALNYVLRNTGATPLDITGYSISGPNAADFSHGGSPVTLAPGATVAISLGFTPAAIGNRSATLTISSNAPVLPDITLDLSGTGLPLDLLDQWRMLHFGTVADSGNAANDANPDSDGYSNFFEFAMGTDPNAVNLIPTSFALVGGNMELTYNRSLQAVYQGVAFEVPWSETLYTDEFSSDWIYGEAVQTVTGQTSTSQTVKAVVPMGTSGKRFLRVEAW